MSTFELPDSGLLSPYLRRRIYLYIFNKWRVPRLVATKIVKTVAFCLDPLPWWRRRRAAKEATIERSELEALKAHGFLLFHPQQLPHSEAAIEDCRALYRDAMDSGFAQRSLESFSKPFLVPLTEDCGSLLRQPGIRSFVFSPELMSIVCRYFGSVPVLAEAQLLWSPVNDTLQKSQKFHLDAEDYKQLKLFLHVETVDESCGPLTLLSAEDTQEVCAATGYTGGRRTRLEDEAVERVIGDRRQQVLGAAGSGALIDTSRCLHYGSRGNTRERLVFFLQFVGYYAPKLEAYDWRDTFPSPAELPEPARHMLRLR